MQDHFCRPAFHSADRLFRNSVPLPQNHLAGVALRLYGEEQCQLEIDLPTPRIESGTLRRREDLLLHRFDEMLTGLRQIILSPTYFWTGVHGRRYLFPATGDFPRKDCDLPKKNLWRRQ